MKKNLIFLVVILLSSFGLFAQLPLSENFDDINAGEMPAGWTLESGTYDWQVSDSNPFSGSNSIVCFYDATQEKDSWFFTPALTLEAGKTYNICFMLKAPGWDGIPESLELFAGTDATSTAMTEQIWSESYLILSAYTEMNFSFTPTTDETYYFGWHAFSAADIDYITVDDISIYEAPQIDVAINKSSLPLADVLLHTPNADLEVINFGSQTIDFNVNLTVFNEGLNVYEETVSITGLENNQTTNANFSGFTPEFEGEFVYEYSVTLPEDANQSNNQYSATVNIIDGCEHEIVLLAPALEMGWFGGSISLTTNSIPVLSNATLYSGLATSYTFPASLDSEIEIFFDGQGDLTDDCYWEVYDGEGNLLIEGNGTGDATPVTQTTTGYCEVVINVEEQNNLVSVFPNPASEIVKIQFNNSTFNKKATITVTDISGKNANVSINQTTDNQAEINLSNLQSGIYFINITNGQETFSEMIIKK